MTPEFIFFWALSIGAATAIGSGAACIVMVAGRHIAHTLRTWNTWVPEK